MLRGILFFIVLIQFGCSSFDRHPQSGYSGNSAPRIESDPSSTNQASSSSSEVNATDSALLRSRLKRLENSLSSPKELEQYSRALPYLKSDSERVEFLEQSGFEARQKWMAHKKFIERPKIAQQAMQDLIEAQDIAIGMPENLVRKAWGEPESVDVSGLPEFRNQRWRYSKYVSTPDGYKLEKKSVYFEAGKVAGWEVE